MTALTREMISEAFIEMDEAEVLLMDGFDEAFIGHSQRINEPRLAVYSWELMMKVCIERRLFMGTDDEGLYGARQHDRRGSRRIYQLQLHRGLGRRANTNYCNADYAVGTSCR